VLIGWLVFFRILVTMRWSSKGPALCDNLFSDVTYSLKAPSRRCMWRCASRRNRERAAHIGMGAAHVWPLRTRWQLRHWQGSAQVHARAGNLVYCSDTNLHT
jgi:hypothetical protein